MAQAGGIWHREGCTIAIAPFAARRYISDRAGDVLGKPARSYSMATPAAQDRDDGGATRYAGGKGWPQRIVLMRIPWPRNWTRPLFKAALSPLGILP